MKILLNMWRSMDPDMRSGWRDGLVILTIILVCIYGAVHAAFYSSISADDYTKLYEKLRSCNVKEQIKEAISDDKITPAERKRLINKCDAEILDSKMRKIKSLAQGND